MINLKKIGSVKSSRQIICDDNWDEETASIVLDEASFDSTAFDGLSDFSHVEVIFYMDKVELDKIVTTSRHPRNNTKWPKVGIFAQRGKNRPNQIGVCICKILKVEGRQLHLEGLDAIDGSAVLDIKPWVSEFAPRGETFQPLWISELMKGYWSKNG